MIVTKAQKQEIAKHFAKIDGMSKQDLITFTHKLYLAKEDMERVVFDWLVRGCDLKMMELQEVSVSVMAESNEVTTID